MSDMYLPSKGWHVTSSKPNGDLGRAKVSGIAVEDIARRLDETGHSVHVEIGTGERHAGIVEPMVVWDLRFK